MFHHVSSINLEIAKRFDLNRRGEFDLGAKLEQLRAGLQALSELARAAEARHRPWDRRQTELIERVLFCSTLCICCICLSFNS